MAEGGAQAVDQQSNKIGNDEVVINHIIVQKRKMTSSANGSLFNGIDLSFELSFGTY